MSKRKYLMCAILGIALSFGLFSKAYAVVDSYVVKGDTDGVVRNYKKDELTKSFLDKKIGNEALLYDEFNNYFSKYGLHAFHSDKGKYVENNVITSEFFDSKLNGGIFDLNKFMEDKNTPAIGM